MFLLVFFRRRIMVLKRFSFLLFFFVLVLSCASSSSTNKQAISPETQIKEIEASRQMKAMNERILMAALSSKKDPSRDYKIGPEDLLEISVFEDEKLNKTVRVSSQGNIKNIFKIRMSASSSKNTGIREFLLSGQSRNPAFMR